MCNHEYDRCKACKSDAIFTIYHWCLLRPRSNFLLIYHCLTMAFLFNDYRSFLIINESNGCQRLLGSLGRKSMTWFINTCNSLYIISPTTSQTLRSLVSKLGRWYLLKLGFHFLIKFVFLQWKSIKNNEDCFLFHI